MLKDVYTGEDSLLQPQRLFPTRISTTFSFSFSFIPSFLFAPSFPVNPNAHPQGKGIGEGEGVTGWDGVGTCELMSSLIRQRRVTEL